MDDRTDRAYYAIERRLGPLPEEPSVWDTIEDEHYPQCPKAVAARKKLPSTLCLCDKIKIANDSAEECLRCHNLVAECRCGAKAQLV